MMLRLSFQKLSVKKKIKIIILNFKEKKRKKKLKKFLETFYNYLFYILYLHINNIKDFRFFV